MGTAFTCEDVCCVFNDRQCTPGGGVDERADWAALFPTRLLQAVRQAEARAHQGTQPGARSPTQQGKHGERQQAEQQQEQQKAQEQEQTEQGAHDRLEGQEQQGLQSGFPPAQHQEHSEAQQGAASRAGRYGGLHTVPQHGAVPHARNHGQVGAKLGASWACSFSLVSESSLN